jgi:hypothetical protein
MKKTILSIAIAGIFAACNSQRPVEQIVSKPVTDDTAGLAQFKEWKEKSTVMNAEGVSEETENISTTPVEENTQPATTIIYRNEPAKERSVAKVARPSRQSRTRESVHTPKNNSETNPVTSGNGTDTQPTASTQPATGNGTSTSNGDIGSPSADTLKANKKEGWSKAAKGTAVGAGSGAVLGAIISKNKGKGAVIGGIVGAAGGYVIGRKQDKKEGRQ